MPVRAEIAAFLKRYKKAVVQQGGIYFVPRREGLCGLAELGLTVETAKDVIFALSPAFYCEGPLAEEHGQPGEVWVFGKIIGGEPVYIKLYFSTDATDRRPAKVISFHKAQRAMTFPHRSTQSGDHHERT